MLPEVFFLASLAVSSIGAARDDPRILRRVGVPLGAVSLIGLMVKPVPNAVLLVVRMCAPPKVTYVVIGRNIVPMAHIQTFRTFT